MKTLLSPLFALALITSSLHAEEVVFGEDDATQSAYNNGWAGGNNGGTGFGEWNLYVTQEEGAESHAGMFIGNAEEGKDLAEVAIKGKSFGFFANGKSFEVATAFRRFSTLLVPGDTFSFLMKTGPFKQKFDFDSPDKGAVGLTLRANPNAAKPDDYNTDARFEFGTYEGEDNYQVFDGETGHDTGVPVSEVPISVAITLLTADTYTLEITNLGTKKVTKLENRKLGGAAGAALESFCAFDRDGETADAYFNGFQLSKPAQ